MTQKYKLVISDVDGTLLDSKHQLSQKTIRSIQGLSQKGVKVVLASARSPLAMASIAQHLQLETPLVSFNGAYICQSPNDLMDSIQSLTIEKIDALLIYKIVHEFKETISCSLYSGAQWLVEEYDDWNRAEASIIDLEPTVADFKEVLKEGMAVHKIMCMGSSQSLSLLEKELDRLNISHISYVRSKPTYLEIVNGQASKLKAMTTLSHYYQIALGDMIAIGDNFNDIPMIEHAGLGIAMGNAPDEVKTSARYVTLSNDEDGASLGLEIATK